LWFSTRAEEAQWVAECIKMLLGTAYEEGGSGSARKRGLTPGDFAILMRSTRSEEANDEPRHVAFTRALAARGIPFTLEAGGSVFDRPQVAALRDAFEILRDCEPSPAQVKRLFDARVLPTYPRADFRRVEVVLKNWARLIHDATGPRRRVYPQRLVHELLAAFGLAESGFDDGIMHDLGVFSTMMQDVETVYLSVDSPGRYHEVLNFRLYRLSCGYRFRPPQWK
jgi:DNA helicase-2/ATP-dependent DNA helicase PcrA